MTNNEYQLLWTFDADGVLFSGTMEIMGNVFATSLARHGIPSDESLRHYLSTGGQPIERQYRDMLVRYGIVKGDEGTELLRDHVEYFLNNAYTEIPPLCRDVKPALDLLKGRRMVISTNTPQDALTHRVQHHELDAYFSHWFGRGYEGITSKDNHRQPIMNAFEVGEDEFRKYGVLVGDGTRDMEIAQKWGIRGIGRPTEETSAHQLLEAGAVDVVNDLRELLELGRKLL